mmetsp:Transcript_69902/g.130616  ORF Transcript_69902/g.130616 Transcript_69902/m.130616 type:complete len:207 (+) Transcript_69902:95-715(+)
MVPSFRAQAMLSCQVLPGPGWPNTLSQDIAHDLHTNRFAAQVHGGVRVGKGNINCVSCLLHKVVVCQVVVGQEVRRLFAEPLLRCAVCLYALLAAITAERRKLLHGRHCSVTCLILLWVHQQPSLGAMQQDVQGSSMAVWKSATLVGDVQVEGVAVSVMLRLQQAVVHSQLGEVLFLQIWRIPILRVQFVEVVGLKQHAPPIATQQ